MLLTVDPGTGISKSCGYVFSKSFVSSRIEIYSLLIIRLLTIKISESLCTNRKLIFEIEYLIFGRLKQRCQQNSQNSKGKIFQQIEKRLQTPICYFKSSCEPNIVCPTVERTLAFNKRSKVCLIFNRWVFSWGSWAETPYYTRPPILTVTTKFQTNHSSPNRPLKSQSLLISEGLCRLKHFIPKHFI